jgi:hypothetical protein
MKLTLPHTQNRRMRHPESFYYLSLVPPAAMGVSAESKKWYAAQRAAETQPALPQAVQP